MAFKVHGNSSEPRFSGRENTASGKLSHPLEPRDGLKIESGVKTVAKALGAGEPGRAQGFRPGGHGPGYNHVGGATGMQISIPKTRDQSNVHSCKGVDPENPSKGSRVEPTKNNA